MNKKDDTMPENCIVMGTENNEIFECQKKKLTQASLWTKALHELKKRKLDQVALAATKASCKFCKSIGHVSPTYDPKELKDDQDLTELDCWNPRTKNKMTQFPSYSIKRDVATSIQTGLEMAESVRKSASDNLTENSTEEANVNADFIPLSSLSYDSGVYSLQFAIPAGKDNMDVVTKDSALEPRVTTSEEMAKADSSKDIISSDGKLKIPTRQNYKSSEEHIEKRKVSILGGVQGSMSVRSSRSSIRSGGSTLSPQRVRSVQHSDSRLISPSLTPKRMSAADVVSSASQISGGSKENEMQRNKRSSLKSPTLSKQQLLQRSSNEMSKSERTTVREFRRISEKIGETIASSKLREKEIEHEQQANLDDMNVSPASNTGNSVADRKNLKNISRRSTKPDDFPRKQISFYKETSEKEAFSHELLKEDRISDTRIEDEMRKIQISEEGEKIDHDTLCPCFQALKNNNCTQCTCNPDEDDVKKIEDFLTQLPQTQKPKVKCVSKVLTKIKRIMKMNLDQETADQKILDLLTALGRCDCEGEPCECQLHHLDLGATNSDRNFMAATVLQKLNDILDERLQDKLGIKLKQMPYLRNRSIETEPFTVSTSTASDKIECNICRDKDCTCVTKNRNCKEKSAGYYRRQELLNRLEVPTMTEVKTELGECLAAVVFKECPDALKENMGLEPKLKGAGANLWTSPSDLLVGKVCLKPPLTDKHIKALTHEGILAIGYDIDLKYWNEMELEKRKALLEQEEYLKNIAEKIKRVSVKMARDEEIALCERRCKSLTKEFEEKLQEELDRLEEEMLEYQENIINDAIQSCEEEWQNKLENSVQDTVDRLTKEFLKDLETQKHNLETKFRTEFERQQDLYNNAISKEEAASKTTMEQLRHCLECKNLANLMYVLCMERRKCGIERSVLEYKQRGSMDELNQVIKEKDEQIRKLTEERDMKQRQLDVREKCVVEILKQFQKFINYALRATPTQAEFLLDVRKMMLFEITQAMVARAKEKAPHLARQILPWKTTSESIGSSTGEDGSHLTLPDYHECLDEIIPPAAQSEFMPSFYYNDKMYVSNELQLMARKGMDISETNILWNKDVEHVLKLLKASVEEHERKRQEQRSANEKSPTDENDTEGEQNPQNTNFGKSALKHDSEEKIEIETPIVYCNVLPDKTESKDTSDFIKKIIKASIEVELAPLDTTGLLAAQDSLIKIRESRRNSLKDMPLYGAEEVETNNMLKAVKESLESEFPEHSGKRSVDGSVNFEKLDAIRISEQLEIKRHTKTSKNSISAARKPSKSLLKRDSILHATASPGTLSPPRHSSPVKPNDSRDSKLLSVKDSLIIHRNSMIPTAFRKSGTYSISQTDDMHGSVSSRRCSITSKLSMARDSIELLKKQSELSKCSKAIQNGEYGSVTEEAPIISRKISPQLISHIEIAQIPTIVPETAVNFSPVKEVYEVNVLKTSDSPWKIYEEPQVAPDNFLTKPNELKISGNQDSKEHLQGSPSFTTHRINSIMNILREEPSLMRLFTSGTK